MKLHLFARGAVAALILTAALVGMAGPAAALPGPVEDFYRDVVEPLPGTVDQAIEDACDTADCAGIFQDIADLQQGVNEDIEFLTEELPCEQTGNCSTVEERVAAAQSEIDGIRELAISAIRAILCFAGQTQTCED